MSTINKNKHYSPLKKYREIEKNSIKQYSHYEIITNFFPEAPPKWGLVNFFKIINYKQWRIIFYYFSNGRRQNKTYPTNI